MDATPRLARNEMGMCAVAQHVALAMGLRTVLPTLEIRTSSAATGLQRSGLFMQDDLSRRLTFRAGPLRVMLTALSARPARDASVSLLCLRVPSCCSQG